MTLSRTALPTTAWRARTKTASLALAISISLASPAAPGGAAEFNRNHGAVASGALGTRTGATLPVTTCDDAGAGSLRAVVAGAGSGDTVDLTGLTCSVISLTTGTITIGVDDLAIIGPGAATLAIDGNYSDRVLTHTGTGTVAISQITITRGVRSSTTPPYDTARGGCIDSAGAISLDHAAVSHCVVAASGSASGGCINTAIANVADSVISDCVAQGYGSALVYGGGINAAAVTMTRSRVENNAVLASEETYAAEGGGIRLFARSAFDYTRSTIEDCTITGNTVTGRPYDPDPYNWPIGAAHGGGIHAGTTVTISRSTLSNNHAGSGGAIWAVTPSACHDCELVSIVDSTISGNSADVAGGGIAMWDARSSLGVRNSTVAFNSAYYAGGILPRHWLYAYNYDLSPTFESTIVASNTASVGPADVNAVGAQPGFEILGSHNVIPASNIPVPVDTIAADPLLAALGNNGGPTLTHALLAGSPAIDSGTNLAGLAFDQRGSGYPREAGAAPDIGAFEVQPGASGIPAAERQVLIDLYNSAGGAQWASSAGWLGSPGTECQWEGITCDATDSHVEGIDLSYNLVIGQLPQSVVTGLPELASFDVSYNYLSGGLPALQGATKLQHFSVAHNYLSGTIPPLANLPMLADFTVNRNELTGTIPEIHQLTTLELFDVGKNQLTGELPSLEGLAHLWAFGAALNQLSGPIPSLDGLASLEELLLAQNQLTGSIPSVQDSPHLRQLIVDDNQLTGALPTLQGLMELQYVFAHRNQLSGELPSLQGLDNLLYFYVGDNQFTGGVPSIDGMQRLEGFGVDNNELTGTLPEELNNLPNLSFYDVGGNQLEGPPPILRLGVPLSPGGSSLCPNSLDHVESPRWDTATGQTPWYQDCATAPDDSIFADGFD